jgi:hypothetical protein
VIVDWRSGDVKVQAEGYLYMSANQFSSLQPVDVLKALDHVLTWTDASSCHQRSPLVLLGA